MTRTIPPHNALPDYPAPVLREAVSGPLSGLRLAVKDIFDITGMRTGCGNPDREAEAGTAERSAPGVRERFDFGRDIGSDAAAAETGLRNAPRMDASFDALQTYRERALGLLCLSSLSDFPQITLPPGQVDSAPFGIARTILGQVEGG